MMSFHVSWMSGVHDLFWYNYLRCTVCGKFVRLFLGMFVHFFLFWTLSFLITIAAWHTDCFPWFERERQSVWQYVHGACLRHTKICMIDTCTCIPLWQSMIQSCSVQPTLILIKFVLTTIRFHKCFLNDYSTLFESMRVPLSLSLKWLCQIIQKG